MLLTHPMLMDLVRSGIIQNVEDVHVNAASIDIRLGDSLLVESGRPGIVDLELGEIPEMRSLDPDVNGAWRLRPGQFCLVNSCEIFNLPNDIAAEFKLRSSVARAGIDHALAGWADPGWHDATLTMELRNGTQNHTLLLRPGLRIGQMVFWRGEPVPQSRSYAARGRYNNQRSATESRGV